MIANAHKRTIASPWPFCPFPLGPPLKSASDQNQTGLDYMCDALKTVPCLVGHRKEAFLWTLLWMFFQRQRKQIQT